MKNLLRSVILCLTFLTTAAAHADPIDVTYTVTGTTNNWTYDFAFTNNLTENWSLYFLGVNVESPVSQSSSGNLTPWYSYNNYLRGGSATTYKTSWLDTSFVNAITPSETVHLVVNDSSADKLTDAKWFAYGLYVSGPSNYDPSIDFTGPHFSSNWNPGFEGEAIQAAVPEPETYAMLLGGLGLLGAIARRRKQA